MPLVLTYKAIVTPIRNHWNSLKHAIQGDHHVLIKCNSFVKDTAALGCTGTL